MSKCEGCQKFADCSTGSGLTWPCGAYVPKQPEDVKITVTVGRVKGFSEEITVARYYMEIGGVTTELHKTVGCDRHMVTADKSRHFCIGQSNTIRELPAQKAPWYCGEVCDYMKSVLKREIEQHGKWMEEKTIQKINEYIGRENTVSWKEAVE